MLSAGKWVELETVMLSKISQTKKDTLHVLSHIRSLDI
jgi:hypothetical protein